ncbi:MAG: hypothetical protein GY719_01845 [bacterium]|nr:hypothetical protein [bacterium]
MSKSKSFGVFLDTFEKETSERSHQSKVNLDLLKVLPPEGEIAVTDLYEGSGLGIQQFSKTLDGICDSGIVELAVSADREVVRFTEMGRRYILKG